MKVLFITSWYPTKNNPNFGIFVKEHAKAIQTTDVELIVLAVVIERSNSFFRINIRNYQDDSGFQIVEILISSRFRDLIYHIIPLQNRIAYHFFNKQIAQEFNPDIVHSNVVFPAGMIGDFFYSTTAFIHDLPYAVLHIGALSGLEVAILYAMIFFFSIWIMDHSRKCFIGGLASILLLLLVS